MRATLFLKKEMSDYGPRGGWYDRRGYAPGMALQRRLDYDRFPPPPGPRRLSPPPQAMRGIRGGISPSRRSRSSPPPRQSDFNFPTRRVQEEYGPQERFRENDRRMDDRYPPPKKQKILHPKDQSPRQEHKQEQKVNEITKSPVPKQQQLAQSPQQNQQQGQQKQQSQGQNQQQQQQQQQFQESPKPSPQTQPANQNQKRQQDFMNQRSGGKFQQQNQKPGGAARQAVAEPTYSNQPPPQQHQQYQDDGPIQGESGPVAPAEPHSRRVKKFSSRCRLFVGNVQGMEETEFADMFSRFGEIQEPYIHKEKGFGFVKMVSNIVDCVVIEYLQFCTCLLCVSTIYQDIIQGLQHVTSLVYKYVSPVCMKIFKCFVTFSLTY